MKTIQKILIVVFAIASFSCSKDDENKPEPKTVLNLLTKEMDQFSNSQYKYNEKNQLIGKSSSNIGSTSSETITYNAANKIDEIVGTSFFYSFKQSFTYNIDGSLKQKETLQRNFNGNYSFQDKKTYDYALNRVIENKEDSQNKKSRKIFDYDTKGNLVKVSSYNSVTDANPTGTLETQISYTEFDDKNYLYAGFPPEYNFPFSFKNNIIKINDQAPRRLEYNDDGYPIRELFVNGESVFKTFEYQRIE